MSQFVVEGGNPLSGSIRPSGNKNEALPVLAAVLLTSEPVVLHNMPEIVDTMDMRHLLVSLGVQVSKLGANSYRFHAQTLTSDQPDQSIAAKIRGSFLLAGPMLARHGSVVLPSPGGDRIGLRPVKTHLDNLEFLGATVSTTEDRSYRMQTQGLTATDLYLDEASVMATENLIMAAVLAKGTTTIYNAACEPHVQGLCNLLNQMGAKISGVGSNHLFIEGVEALRGCEYTIQPDHTEVGSFIGLAAVTRSELTIEKAGIQHLKIVRMMFDRLGVPTVPEGDDLRVLGSQLKEVQFNPSTGIPKIDDGPWPAFPADLTSIMTVVATQCKGTVLIFEKMFESRLFWVDKLISMGAKIILCDPHRAVVTGPTPLYGTTLSSPDIRAGMALLIAALGAEGKSVIQNIQQIDRGYESIDTRLNKLGARIHRV